MKCAKHPISGGFALIARSNYQFPLTQNIISKIDGNSYVYGYASIIFKGCGQTHKTTISLSSLVTMLSWKWNSMIACRYFYVGRRCTSIPEFNKPSRQCVTSKS